MKTRVLFLVGPTAAGKSEVAMECARRLSAEIVSADSMQIYRGMDIGTAKPGADERKGIPHHLIDLISFTESFSVAQYREAALEVIRGIVSRGRIPIVAGGTGLYVRALVAGLSGQPAGDEAVRRRLETEIGEKGLECLYRRLVETDAKTAGRIKPGDRKRIIRALEIAELSGKTTSEWHRDMVPLESLGYEPCIIGIARARQDLYRDIETRVDRMFDRGLLEEVRRLREKGLSRTAAQAVGYKELLPALDGKYSVEEAKQMIKLSTRHLAKRQMTWFRKEKNIIWVAWITGRNVKTVSDEVVKIWESFCTQR